MLGITDVEEKPETGTGAASQTDLWIDRDVVALIRARRRTLIAASLPGRPRTAAPALTARWRPAPA